LIFGHFGLALFYLQNRTITCFYSFVCKIGPMRALTSYLFVEILEFEYKKRKIFIFCAKFENVYFL